MSSDTVFGRLTPTQKETLVKALRARGHYVAMIGDGVNDVPALKAAGLAIAMQSGTAAARAVADMVLLEDDFGALSFALREGQRIRGGMHAILKSFLLRVLYMALLIAMLAVVDIGFPFAPKQNALLTLLTVGLPSLALAAWEADGAPLPSIIRVSVRHSGRLRAGSRGLGHLHRLFADGTRPGYAARDGRDQLARVAVSRAHGADSPLVLMVAFGVISVDPVPRSIFELQALSAIDYLVVALVATMWAVALRAIWHWRLFKRLLGMESGALKTE